MYNIYNNNDKVVDNKVFKFKYKLYINLNSLISRNIRFYLTELYTLSKYILLGLLAIE